MNIVKKLLNSSVISGQLSRQLATSARADGRQKTETPTEGENPKLAHLVNRERSFNQVMLIGRVGNDPVSLDRNKKTGSESSAETDAKKGDAHDDEDELGEIERNLKSAACVFSLATSEYAGLGPDGAPKFRVDWHRIVVMASRDQNTVRKYVRKGDRIHVTGRLHYNMSRYKSGEPRLLTSVVCDDIIFLGKNVNPDLE